MTFFLTNYRSTDSTTYNHFIDQHYEIMDEMMNDHECPFCYVKGEGKHKLVPGKSVDVQIEGEYNDTLTEYICPNCDFKMYD